MRNRDAGGLNQPGFGHLSVGHSPRGVIVSLIIQPSFCDPGAISVTNVSDFVEQTVVCFVSRRKEALQKCFDP
jgi:hypothetical protein